MVKRSIGLLAAALAFSAAPPSSAAITGLVIDAATSQPLAGARVRVQTTTVVPAISDGSGRFVLASVPPGLVVVTAVLPYAAAREVNYITGSTSAQDGEDVLIVLERLPAEDVSSPYDPGTSFTCGTCHADQHAEWLSSNHANAGRNEWVLDLFSGTGTPGGSAGYVFRDTHEADDSGFCATCHAPLEDAQNPGNVFLDEVELAAGLDGVTCLACHQMAEVNDQVSALHHLGNARYRFPNDAATLLWVWGPLDDVSFGAMRASYQPQFSTARFCASCHEYNNPSTGAPGQNTYTEWLASPFAQVGPGFRDCQDCHMPAAAEPGPVSSLGGQPIRQAGQRRDHAFVGATTQTLSEAIELSVEAVQQGPQLKVRARVVNAGAGHHFPTGISIRNALLLIEARLDGQALALDQGPVIPFYGSAQGGATVDDLAGRPGKGYARVLEGRINGQGPIVRPVLFIDAERVTNDTRIPSGSSDQSEFLFSLAEVDEPASIEVSARLLYRRAWRDTAVTKGWSTTPTGGPIEIEVNRQDLAVPVTPPVTPTPVAVPALAPYAVLVLGLALLLIGLGARRPERH